MTLPMLALALLVGGAGGTDTVPAVAAPPEEAGAMIAALRSVGPWDPAPTAAISPLTAITAAARTVRTAPTADRWLAEDKLRHFALSFATVQLGYGAGRVVFDREASVPVAAGLSLLLGVGKEVHDARSGGPFSARDLAWDLAGVALAVAFVRRIE